MDCNPFSREEVAGRIERLRKAIGGRNLDAAVFASPENVFISPASTIGAISHPIC
jgi:Xaa-Pro dipeptidase